MSPLKRLGKDSIIYGVGGVFARSASFLLLPVYTRIFSPADYGIIEMLVIIGGLLSAVLNIGLDAAQSMYFFKFKDKGIPHQARVVSSIFQFRILWGAVVVFLATLFSPIINKFLFGGNLSWHYFAIAFSGVFFSQILGQSSEILRLLYRPWGYIFITFSQTLIGAMVGLLAIIVFEQGILGFFIGTLTASVLVGCIGWFLVREYLDFKRLHSDLWPKFLRFGVPLVPAGLAMYFMSAADRWFVQYYHGEDALGVFAVAAKLVLMLALIVETFRQAWWPIAMEAMQSDSGEETFRVIARLYVGFGIPTVLLFMMVSPWLIRYIAPPIFYDAWPVVGVLAWQSFFYGFFLISSAGIWRAEKTHFNLYLMTASAFLGIVLNFILVPHFGALGASVATVITYFGWVSATMFVSERLWRVDYPVWIFFIQGCVAASFVTFFVSTHAEEYFIIYFVLWALISLGIIFSALPTQFFLKYIKR